ncbi:hypothetical protein T09_4092 [Trichinella sp. T9]|nr:hypothetical protein T09_4092 [Trichinella sp. T9]
MRLLLNKTLPRLNEQTRLRPITQTTNPPTHATRRQQHYDKKNYHCRNNLAFQPRTLQPVVYGYFHQLKAENVWAFEKITSPLCKDGSGK